VPVQSWNLPIGSSPVKVTLIDCFKMIKETRGHFSGELLEIANHMHLIVISELVRDIGPGISCRHCLALESCFEPGNPRQELWPNSDLQCELPFELTATYTCVLRKKRDLDIASAAQNCS